MQMKFAGAVHELHIVAADGGEMKEVCPCCSQPLPVKGERSCARCRKKIGRNDKWHAIGSLIFHRDCNDRTLSGSKIEKQPQLIDVSL